MAYQTPKTNWSPGDIPSNGDFNRIEGNISALAYLRIFSTSGGTATSISVADGAFELQNGRHTTFVASHNNNGASTTINVQGTGSYPLYRPGTTSAPKIYAGKAYTVWYSSAGLCFFVKASAEGDAVAANVLAGKTFSNDDDTNIVGAMPNRSGDTAALSSAVSGTTLRLMPSNGYRDGTDDHVTITDANWIEENILAGKNIFGKSGTAKRRASGSASVSGGTVSVNGLSFTPSVVVIHRYSNPGDSWAAYVSTDLLPSNHISSKILYDADIGTINWSSLDANWVIGSGSFSVSGLSGTSYNWIAYE